MKKEQYNNVEFQSIKLRNNRFKVELLILIKNDYYTFEYAVENNKSFKRDNKSIIEKLLNDDSINTKVRIDKAIYY